MFQYINTFKTGNVILRT